MQKIIAQFNAIIDTHGNANTVSFQQKIEEFLIQQEFTTSRYNIYKTLFLLNEKNLTEENSDYLADIVSDLRGYTGKIFYRFTDDPDVAYDDLLAYVRSNTWNKGKL